MKPWTSFYKNVFWNFFNNSLEFSYFINSLLSIKTWNPPRIKLVNGIVVVKSSNVIQLDLDSNSNLGKLGVPQNIKFWKPS